MICGAGSFPHEHDEEPPSTPRKGKQINPYSTRGLDKFSTVLAELGAKKERIMARTRDSQGVALVQFVYHNSKDWVPIVVMPKPDKQKQPPPPPLTEPSSTQTQTTVGANKQDQSKDIVVAAAAATEKATATATATERGKVRSSCRRSLYSWRPSYYWPSVLVLILVCLVMFGRVFAICCTSIWWYMRPTLKELYSNAGAGDEDAKKKNMRKKKKEKEYGRKLSDKRLTTPSSQAKKS